MDEKYLAEVVERFLKYARINTQSDPESGMHPSAVRELALAKLLKDELTELGGSDVKLTEQGYVYARFPASVGCENAPAVGFIAHMDTSPDCSGQGVEPILHKNYDGGEIVLSDRTLSPLEFPELKSLRGKTVITSDGTTLLGADDKAGVAEIMTLLKIITFENIPHGTLSVAFTPDEEIGEGADSFDVEGFGCDFAYTVDGEEPGEVVYENFNAASAVFEITGKSVHPGSAKNTMVNAALVACEINSLLPGADIPARTEAREGFYHLCGIEGGVEKAKLSYIVRDHDAGLFASRLALLRHIEKTVNEKYGGKTAALTIKEQYRNMVEMIEKDPRCVKIAEKAVKAAGLDIISDPIRGGTDGARLSFMGLPTPNLGTGGHAFHGPFEFIAAEDMWDCMEILLNIVTLCSREKR